MVGRLFLLMMVLSVTSPMFADESPADNSGEARTTVAADEIHPVYSNDAHWAGPVLTVIAGLFLAALVIGPIVRAEAPQAVPEAMSHEEDPAADRH